ncbi:hypothetical protein ACXET9_02490 [Brachybacterium sp. DNPG3]
MRFLNRLADPIAEAALGLRRVSAAQWLLRLAPILAAAGAQAVLYPQGIVTNLFGMLVTLAVAVGVLIATFSPDSDLALIAPLALVLGLALRGELTVLVALATGALILVMHVGWALAAMTPAHGELTREAWLLAGSALLQVLAAAIIGAVVVLALLGVDLGTWMLVLGAAAAIGLVALLLPRAPADAKR